MPLFSCRLCGKIFTSAGGRTCTICLSRLDELYPIVREFIRDNPKIGMNVDSVAESLDLDIRYVQALVDMGYLDRDIESNSRADENSRQKLAQEFENSLKEMKEASSTRQAAKSAAASYGQTRYGDNVNKKR